MSTIQFTTVTGLISPSWGHDIEQKLGAPFTANATGKIAIIQIYGHAEGTPTGNTRVGIYSDSAGVPNALIGNWSGGVSFTSLAQKTLTIGSGGTPVSNGTVYWLVMDVDNGVYSGVNYYDCGGDNTNAHGHQVLSLHNGSTWQTDYATSTINAIVQIDATIGGSFLVFM